MGFPGKGLALFISLATFAIAMLAGLAMIARPASATYLPQERIPTDSPVYAALERLSARFGTTPRFLSMRPLQEREVVAYLRELRAAHPEAAEDPAFLVAAREVDPDAAGATRPLISTTGENRERFEISPYASLLYSDDPRNDPDINRDYRLGVLASGSLDSADVYVMDVYWGTSSQGGQGTPNFGTLNSVVEGVDFNSWIREAYLEVPISKIRLLFGHTWLRWGPGILGTLALADAAPALDMLRGEVTAFRNFRFTWFVSLLDPGPQTYLAGHRLELRANERLSLGLTELARFDGTSQAPLYFVPFVPYSLWEKRPKSGGVDPADTSGIRLNKNNVLQAVDASWSFHPGFRVWAEMMVDDASFSSDYKPDLFGYQLGAQWRRALGAGGSAIGAQLEYDRVHNYVYSAWHAHNFEFQGSPTGFVLGPDVEALAGSLTYERSGRWEFGLHADWRRKGEGQLGEAWDQSMGKVDAAVLSGVVERELRLAGSAAYHPKRWLRVEGAIGTASFKDYEHLLGNDIDATPIRISSRIAW